MPTKQDPLEVVRQFVHAVNKNDWVVLNKLYADSVISWASPSGTAAKGPKPRQGIQRNSDRFYAAWPDCHLELERVFAQGEWVCAQTIWTGTHKGPLKLASGETYPPTNKKITSSICIVFRVQHGRITHKEEYYDSLDWWRQLGVSPPAGGVVMDTSKRATAQ